MLLFEKDKENDSYSPFRSLPMQAALGLYLPHDEERSNPFSKTKPTHNDKCVCQESTQNKNESHANKENQTHRDQN